MPHSVYVIIGGGMAADAAVRGIREVDANGSIAVISAEPDPPYQRPPLSKKLWLGMPPERVWLKTSTLGATLYLARTARALDLPAKQVVDDHGTRYTFEKLLLATGVTPLRLPFSEHLVNYYRTLNDYRRLRAQTEHGQRFAVVGGGFIGSEIAAVLAQNGKDVTLIFPGAAICSRPFPADLAGAVTQRFRREGVAVLAGTKVTGVTKRGDQVVLTTRARDAGTERELIVDGVVAGIGTRPNTELAAAANLATTDGIPVDEFLRTSHPDIYAAGDAALFCQPALGSRRRVEHEDNATVMGRQAGRAMAGKPAPYRHLAFFYSDLFDLGYEAVGEVDARLDTVADWIEPHRQGVIYYLRQARVRGVLLWNVWDRVDAARELIADARPVRPAELIGRIAP